MTKTETQVFFLWILAFFDNFRNQFEPLYIENDENDLKSHMV